MAHGDPTFDGCRSRGNQQPPIRTADFVATATKKGPASSFWPPKMVGRRLGRALGEDWPMSAPGCESFA